MSSSETVEERVAEFEAHVWDHAQDPFQVDFDTRPPLSHEERQALSTALRSICRGSSDSDLAEVLRQELVRNRKLIYVFLQAAGLTRSKILTDLRAMRRLSESGVRVPSSPDRLHSLPGTWTVAGPYLAKRLRKVLEPLCQTAGPIDGALEAISQATWPGWIRQERAKRQGHEAESRLARILVAMSIPFEPPEKALNPLSGDVQLHDVSFDLVVPSLARPLVCVKATVHTANIGQYGESKDALEIREAGQMLEEHYDRAIRPMLLALVDGVGFRSNRAGLSGVLREADEFCQFRTIWKGAVVPAARLGLKLALGLPKEEIQYHARFLQRYSEALRLHELEDDFLASRHEKQIPAGDGVILAE